MLVEGTVSDSMTEQAETCQKLRRESRVVLALLLLWALLPVPLVWISFYQFHSFWIAILAYGGIVCVFPTLLIHLQVLLNRQRRLNQQNPRKRLACKKRSLLLTAGLIVLTWLVLEGGWLWFKKSMLNWESFPEATASIGLTPGLPFWLLVIYFVALNPVVEEFFWRGVVYERLKSFVSPWHALLWSSLLFGAWHWVIIQYFFTPAWQIALTFLVCLGGVIFGLLYERSKSLLPAILVHGLGADLVIMLILWDAINTQPSY